MAESAYTRGPWFVGAQNDGLYVIDRMPSPAGNDAPVPATAGPQVVATPNWRVAEYRANARLIAAAPDLVEALKDALRSSRKDFKAGPDGDRQHREAYAQQFSALSRALGKEG